MKALGYSHLNQYYKLLLPKLDVEVYQDDAIDKEKLISYGASKRKLIPVKTIIENPYDNMVLAIKHQGIRLHFFFAIFNVVDVDELTQFIKRKPNSSHNRVIWYLYEWLMNEPLDIPDLKAGNYINLFDDQFYYTIQNGDRDRRTRITNNAIGTREFCPTIRKTPKILELEKVNVYETAYAQMQKIGQGLNADIIGRSINYLYTKESKSSTEIEKETPTKLKMKRFLNAIKNAGLFELSKEKLIDVKNQIVEDKKRSDDYRSEEIYVGATIQRLGGVDQDVHYVGPLSKYVPGLMNGLFNTHDRLMIDGCVPSLMHAAIISFGEVYIHPLNDGNGRTHRYLIHDVMKQREPDHEFIIPISAAILKHQEKYDKVLESISRPTMAMLEWDLDETDDHKVVINNDITYMYRYPDYTEHVIFTYDMMDAAISEDLIDEVCLLLVFDEIKKEINSAADVENSKVDKIVSMILNGKGSVSQKKREFVLKHITEEVLGHVEEVATIAINIIEEKFNVDLQKVVSRE